MRLKESKVAFLVSQEFEDIELLYPLVRLSGEGAWIVIGTAKGPTCAHPRPASLEKIEGKIITGRFGCTVPILFLEEGKRYSWGPVEELKPEEFHAVIVPGGFSPDYLRINEKALAFVQEMNAQGKTVTSYIACKDDIVNARAKFEDVPVVRDGNIITSRTPDDLPEFCGQLTKGISERH